MHHTDHTTIDRSLSRAADRYARAHTSTRCAYMGSSQCRSCTVPLRGYCQYRAMHSAFLAGYRHAFDTDPDVLLGII